jgi:hypothetical protein
LLKNKRDAVNIAVSTYALELNSRFVLCNKHIFVAHTRRKTSKYYNFI